MPELPEVEFARRCLENWLLDRRLRRVVAEPSRVLRRNSTDLKVLEGRSLLSTRRRGKLLMLCFDRELALLSHLGMTGKWVLVPAGKEAPSHSRARLEREDGAWIHYQDPRMFGWLKVGPAGELAEDPSWMNSGPDALVEMPGAQELHLKLGSSRRSIKDLLMDQSLLSGLGNIQVTEALFHARISPLARGNSLSREMVEAVISGIEWTLRRTLDDLNGGEGIQYLSEAESSNPFSVYGRTGEPCPRCGTTLESIRISGRTTVFCPNCQKDGL